jgi:hypothetical protein
MLILLGAALMAILIPINTFLLLKTRLDTCNAAALAAAYGSVSAVTFVTAVVSSIPSASPTEAT